MKRSEKATTFSRILVGAAVLCIAWSGTAVAGDGSDGGKPDGKESKKEDKKDKKDKKDEFPKFDEVVKDMEVMEGFFTLYYDKKKDSLLGRIPKSVLNEPFLLSISISKGPTYAGWMIGGAAVYWDRIDKKLVLMEADPRFKKGKGSTVEDVISRTYTDAIIKAIDIKTEAPGGDPVIDLGDLLKWDMVGIGQVYGGRRLDPKLTRWCTTKAFPDNVELAVDAALMGKKSTDTGIIAAVHFSMSKLPKNDYEPREADDRIGYFLTAQQDWSVPHTDKTVFKRYIHRWNLEKQDPKAAESPVKNPIVFYIEKTVPIQYRRYVREGILEWNKAFEKCGLLSAVQVRQQTDTNEFKDLDPEDVRYNFFRWVVSGRAFARGPSRVNPFTGQILDADIVFDDSMARFYVQDYALMGPQPQGMFHDPVVQEFFEHHPEYLPPATVANHGATPAWGKISTVESSFMDPISMLLQQDEQPCELGAGMVHQMAFSQLVAAQRGMAELPEKFIGQVIREIVMHEVGHTLGLRHNFKASAWRSMEEITTATADSRLLTGSVMDYNPVEFAAIEEEQADFATTTIGPYDEWAIEYGYRPFLSGGEHDSQEAMLKAVTARVAEEGLAYATDEDTSAFGPDPYVFRFDNGDDPVAFAKSRMEMVERLFEGLSDRAVEDGESYFRLRRAFNIVLNEYAFAATIAARMVGGQSVSRDHKGDPDAREPFVIVSADKQREALEFLGETVFSDAAYEFPTELLNRLGPGRFWHWGSDQMDFNIDYDVHARVLAIQSWVLTLLTNPMTVNRIYDAEIKVPQNEDALTVPELFTKITSIIWSEVQEGPARGKWTDRQPRISSFRRNLQREHLRRMINVLLSEPGRGLNADAHAVVRMSLKELKTSVDEMLIDSRNSLDTYTLAHLDETSHRIEKALDAEFTDGASNGGRRRPGRRFGQSAQAPAGVR